MVDAPVFFWLRKNWYVVPLALVESTFDPQYLLSCKEDCDQFQLYPPVGKEHWKYIETLMVTSAGIFRKIIGPGEYSSIPSFGRMKMNGDRLEFVLDTRIGPSDDIYVALKDAGIICTKFGPFK